MNWIPVFNDEMCGCKVEITEAKTNHDFVRWINRCEAHKETEFKELWRLSIEDNLSRANETPERIEELREIYYTKYGLI